METKLVSAFDVLVAQILPLDDKYCQEAYKYLVEESFDEFLNFCSENGCFNKQTLEFLKFDVYVYEVDKDGNYVNYYEEDFDKRNKIVEKIFNNINKYANVYEKSYTK